MTDGEYLHITPARPSELRLSELYTSIQGEGPNVGQPTQFVRFAGCNLRCPGWPCDTPHAIDPAIWHVESEKLDFEALYRRLAPWPMSLTLTGGEPFLQKNRALKDFIELAICDYEIDIFTNGTLRFPEWMFGGTARGRRVILDWKLAGSGEQLPAKQLENRKLNASELGMEDSVKFTVMNREDLEEALTVFHELISDDFVGEIYVGAVWGELGDAEIIDFLMHHELDWKLNVQLHKYIWPPDKRGV
jgi:7-carboxy-7-deazaguanine synthase